MNTLLRAARQAAPELERECCFSRRASADVGYCYNRFTSMFSDLEAVMRNIINCCAVARVSFHDAAALYDLWRYLNLLHVTAYCGGAAQSRTSTLR